jgi:hypothetical protein
MALFARGIRVSPRRPLILAVLTLSLLASSSSALAIKTCYTQIDVPNATETMALGVSKKDVIVGAYRDASGLHGFRRDPDGTVTPIDVPNAIETEARGINSEDTIVGRYTDVNLVSHGFRLRPNDKLVTIDVPGATATVASAIDTRGGIVGHYTDAAALDHGFLLDNSAFQTLDAPGGLCGTRAFGIIKHNRIVGSFSDCGTQHGFLLLSRYTTLDIPGAVSTMAHGRKRSRVVGDYVDVNGKTHGFLLRTGHFFFSHDFRTLDFPGAVETHARGIATGAPGRQKQIVGWHVDALGKTHGWHADLKGGC